MWVHKLVSVTIAPQKIKEPWHAILLFVEQFAEESFVFSNNVWVLLYGKVVGLEIINDLCVYF